ncbi:MAG: porphobilinogen synthase [Candidatus Bathyarchaeia archaeon]
MFPKTRMRRLRRTPQIRELVRETTLTPRDFIYPVFVKEDLHKPEPIESMPGQFRIPLEAVINEGKEVLSVGIPSVILFGIPSHKDEEGSAAYDKNGVVQQAVRKLKSELGHDLVVVTDVCLCQYTSHGHCGIISKGAVLNDPTLEVLQKVAVSHAEAGADIVAPSGMIDGQVKALREALDQSGFYDVAVMAYAAKYASCFYGPFKEAAYSSPAFGDRRTLQMDPGNLDEGIREVRLDIDEGADIIMVKPALAYLDLIYRVKTEVGVPTAAYSVSGEYSMIKAAAQNGWLDGKSAALEVLTAIKRAGADIIITYAAKEAAGWLKRE